MSAALAAAAQTPPAYEHNQGHVLIALQNGAPLRGVAAAWLWERPDDDRGRQALASGRAMVSAWLLTRETSEWEAHEFIAAVQAAIDGVEPGPQAKWRDPSVKTTLHDRIGLIPDLLAREPDEVFARIGGIA